MPQSHQNFRPLLIVQGLCWDIDASPPLFTPEMPTYGAKIGWCEQLLSWQTYKFICIIKSEKKVQGKQTWTLGLLESLADIYYTYRNNNRKRILCKESVRFLVVGSYIWHGAFTNTKVNELISIRLLSFSRSFASCHGVGLRWGNLLAD